MLTEPPATQPVHLPCFPPESARGHLLHLVSVPLFMLPFRAEGLPSVLFATGGNNLYSLSSTKPPFPSIPKPSSPHCVPTTTLSLTQSVPATFSQGPLSPCTAGCFPPWRHRMPLISLSRQLKTTGGRKSAERLWFYCRGLHKFLILFLPILTPASETGRADIISTYILEIRNQRLRDRVLGCDCTVEIQVRHLSSLVLLHVSCHAPYLF